MNIPAFDTQKAVKAFTGAGFDDKQAEAVVTTMADVMSQNFATKADHLALKSDMEQTIEKVRTDLEQTIEKVRTDLEQTIEKVRIDLEQSIEKLRRDMEQSISSLERRIAVKFETLYRHLWVMGIGIVLTNVSLVAAVVALLGHKVG